MQSRTCMYYTYIYDEFEWRKSVKAKQHLPSDSWSYLTDTVSGVVLELESEFLLPEGSSFSFRINTSQVIFDNQFSLIMRCNRFIKKRHGSFFKNNSRKVKKLKWRIPPASYCNTNVAQFVLYIFGIWQSNCYDELIQRNWNKSFITKLQRQPSHYNYTTYIHVSK